MELLMRVVVLAVIVIAVFLAAYLIVTSISPMSSVTKEQAENLVVGDLMSKYPGAEINITNATSSIYPGSWEIIVGIIVNSTSPCPSYFVDTFEYPKFGFVNRTQNTYTGDCKIQAYSQGQRLYNSPVAITRAYNVSGVKDYLGAFGFGNVTVTARNYTAAKLQGTDYSSIWLVNYSSARASYNFYVVLSQLNGSILNAYNNTK